MSNVPAKTQLVLDEYFQQLEQKFPILIESFYLYGSISLGAFKDGFSDIDFIAIIKGKLTESELKMLKEIHKSIQSKFPETILDGFYIIKEDFVNLNKGKVSSIRFNDGKFHGFTAFDKNTIDAFQLQKYGILIKGEKLEENIYTVDWNILIPNMRHNLNTYWLGWMNDCRRFPSIKYISLYFSINMIEWGVLGVSRLYYTFIEKDIISKAGAGEYALRKVPEKYHKIIKEALRNRQGIKKSYYRSIVERRKDTLDYMEFMMKECHNLFIE